MISKIKSTVDRLLSSNKWYIRIFIGGWLSIYTSFIIWIILTSWNPLFYQEQTLKLIAIYTLAIAGYSWLIFTCYYFIYKRNTFKSIFCLIANLIISISLVHATLYGVIFYKAFIKINSYELRYVDVKINEYDYYLSSEINNIHVFAKHNNLGLYTNYNIGTNKFYNYIIDTRNKKSVIGHLIMYNSYRYGQIKSKEIGTLEAPKNILYNIINHIFMKTKNIASFNMSEFVLIYEFLKQDYSILCTRYAKGEISKKEFVNLAVPVNFYLKNLNHYYPSLYKKIIDPKEFSCFTNKIETKNKGYNRCLPSSK